MTASFALVRLARLLVVLPAVRAYLWPNPQMEALDSLRFEQGGPAVVGTGEFVSPCLQFGFFGDTSKPPPSGRINSADWLRTAYHDMATHNVNDGTGGLDASIRFEEEQSRPENAGDGFKNTVDFVIGFADRHVSFADSIAVAALVAVEQCGGPLIAFRGGRIDAQEPNNPGVPQPQEDLASHTANFARQGFTPEEMIGLVACGHTIGGVQHTAFPEIAQDPGTPNNTDGNVHFDSTFSVFDNKIATDYITGNTGNPLVVGPNITTRSDMRIFSSDNNKTMAGFANDSESFMSTCGTLFAKMLDTVPRGVELTDVVTPLPVKPTGLQLVLNTDGSLNLSGSFRFWDLDSNVTRTITLEWADVEGKSCEDCMTTLTHNSLIDFSTSPGYNTALWYQFQDEFNGVHIPASVGISSFWFKIDENGETTVRNQDGRSFSLQTAVLPYNTSCLFKRPVEADQGFTSMRLDVAVRKDAHASRVWVEGDYPAGSPLRHGPAGALVLPATLNETASRSDEIYDIYNVVITPDNGVFENTFNVAATIGGKNMTSPTGYEGQFAALSC